MDSFSILLSLDLRKLVNLACGAHSMYIIAVYRIKNKKITLNFLSYLQGITTILLDIYTILLLHS